MPTQTPSKIYGDEAEWSCPYCGESVGEPRTVYSREFQGDEAHGGMVEYQDECCTLCEYANKLNDCEYLSRAEIERLVDVRRQELAARQEAK